MNNDVEMSLWKNSFVTNDGIVARKTVSKLPTLDFTNYYIKSRLLLLMVSKIYLVCSGIDWLRYELEDHEVSIVEINFEKYLPKFS